MIRLQIRVQKLLKSYPTLVAVSQSFVSLLLSSSSYFKGASDNLVALCPVYYVFTYRKKLFVQVHYFVHLNLSISLLLAYLVFVLGIELANTSVVSSRNLYSCFFFNSCDHLHRVVVHLWLLSYTTSFWQHSVGCCVKE